MAPKPKLKPVAQILDLMAARLESAARELQSMSKAMREHGDLGQAADAAAVITNLLGNLPLDRLINQSLLAKESDC